MLISSYFKYFSVASACCASDSGAAVQDGAAGQDQTAEQSAPLIDQLEHGPDQNLTPSVSVNSLHWQPSACSCNTVHRDPSASSSQSYHIRAGIVNINYGNNNNDNASNDNGINKSARESSGSQYSVHVESEPR